MKYLERREVPKDEIINTLKDILLELNDIGYITTIYDRKVERVISINIKIGGKEVTELDNNPFRRGRLDYFSNISYSHPDDYLFNETLLRIKDYMKHEGYIIEDEDIKLLPISTKDNRGLYRMVDGDNNLHVCNIRFKKYKKKYANLFESMDDSKSRKSALSAKISWPLILDIKDMALDYIDEGLSLYIYVCNDDDKVFYKIFFNHKRDINEWVMSNINLPTKGVIYDIYLCEDRRIDKKSTLELLDRLKMAYPWESIKDHKK